MGRGSAPAREISFVSLVAYGPKVSHSALAMGVTASETRQGGSQQGSHHAFYDLFSEVIHCYFHSILFVSGACHSQMEKCMCERERTLTSTLLLPLGPISSI